MGLSSVLDAQVSMHGIIMARSRLLSDIVDLASGDRFLWECDREED